MLAYYIQRLAASHIKGTGVGLELSLHMHWGRQRLDALIC